jgi:hypothetical protein
MMVGFFWFCTVFNGIFSSLHYSALNDWATVDNEMEMMIKEVSMA